MTVEVLDRGLSAALFPALRKDKFASLILFLFILSPVLPYVKWISVVMVVFLAGYLLLSSFQVPRGIGFLVGPLILFMAVGMMGIPGKLPYNIAQDLWYTGKSLVALILGYVLMTYIRSLVPLLSVIVLSGMIASLYYLSNFILSPELVHESVTDIGKDIGRGYVVSAMAVGVIAGCWRAKVEIFPPARWVITAALGLCLGALVLAFSRTLWITLLIMLVVIFDLVNVKRLKIVLVLTGVLMFLGLAIWMAPKSERTGPNKTFMGKISNSFHEMAIRKYVKRVDINNNWRGYEAYRAVRTYLKGTGHQYITGRGFGALVDLGFPMQLGGEKTKFRYVPILHNGYMYLLVKTGILGIVIYVYYFLRLIWIGRRCREGGGKDVTLAGNFIVAFSLVVLVITMVHSGFFDKGNLLPVAVILGALVAYVRLKANEKRSHVPAD